MNKNISYKEYIYKEKRKNLTIIFSRILIIFFALSIWQLLSNLELINSFIFSSPFLVIKTFFKLIFRNNLIVHSLYTIGEVLFSFILTSFIAFIISFLMWRFGIFSKIIDPYLTILNSLPKVALGPLIIIWVGASRFSIIFMAFLIGIFVTIINFYVGFVSVNKNYIILAKTLSTSKFNLFFQIILPASINSIINALKINVSMTMIGVIMGELLVSKEGIGYLIMYGSQIFDINLIITCVLFLGGISYIMYFIINIIETKLLRKFI